MPRVHQLRGGHLEAVHPFSAVAMWGDRQIGAAGEAISSTWRSSAKPFQLWCSLRLLPGEGFSSDELAVGAASHSAEPRHLALVEGLLRRFDLSADQLRCGAHWPAYHAAGEAVVRQGGAITSLHNNCSGKHTFMLAATLRQGWDPDYLPAHHPLQRRIFEAVSELTGQRPGLGVDGCGVPTFYLPLAAFARAWSHLAKAAAGDGDETLGRIGRAMADHPDLTSGTDRLDLDVKRGAREPLIVKVGAAGLFCMAFPDRGLGVAVKVHSGAEGALGAAVEYTLSNLAPGAWERPSPWPWAEVRNVVGRVVGAWVAHP